MVTGIVLLAVANTTASTTATPYGLDIGDITGIVALIATAITFALTYRVMVARQSRHAYSKRKMRENFREYS